jgi:hypothetical protein
MLFYLSKTHGRIINLSLIRKYSETTSKSVNNLDKNIKKLELIRSNESKEMESTKQKLMSLRIKETETLTNKVSVVGVGNYFK